MNEKVMFVILGHFNNTTNAIYIYIYIYIYLLTTLSQNIITSNIIGE